jgi:hypothetical protein
MTCSFQIFGDFHLLFSFAFAIDSVHNRSHSASIDEDAILYSLSRNSAVGLSISLG